MARPKYEYWKTEDGLILLEGWARDGLIDEQIAKNMGINVATLYRYKLDHNEICEALKKGKAVVDFEVENALLKNALGGDTASQIFWLKNRKPKQWRDKPKDEEPTTQFENMLALADILRNPVANRRIEETE